MKTQRQIILVASFIGGLAVALGAFGAHVLKTILTQNNRVDTYELAVRYHFYHALTLLAVGILMDKFPQRFLSLSAWMFLLGIILFSGSLYIMAIFNTTQVVLITPIGGVFLLTGWSLLFYGALKKN